MESNILTATVFWQEPRWWSRYLKGQVTACSFPIESIWKHKKSGQMRVYSTEDLDGRVLGVDGEPRVVLKARGRFGKLYLAFPIDN